MTKSERVLVKAIHKKVLEILKSDNNPVICLASSEEIRSALLSGEVEISVYTKPIGEHINTHGDLVEIFRRDSEIALDEWTIDWINSSIEEIVGEIGFKLDWSEIETLPEW